MHFFYPNPRKLSRTCIQYFIVFLTTFCGQTLWAQHTISSFTPASGPVGTQVLISGTNFSNIPSGNIVYFGAVKARVTGASTTALTVTVPSGATYQPVTVTTNNLTAFSDKPFIVTFSGGGNGFLPGSFESRRDFIAGSETYHNAVGDLDDDGKIDIVVANYKDSSISIFRNTSTDNVISFATKLNSGTGNSPRFVAIADLNSDGLADIAVANMNSNTISVFRNMSSPGNIQFSPRTDYSTGGGPVSIAIADLDKDGRPEVAVVNFYGSSVSVLSNLSTNGNINLGTKTDFATGEPGNGSFAIAVGDIDGDGLQDLNIANRYSKTLTVLKNTSAHGNISFAPKVNFTASNQPFSIAIGDLDDDNRPDLVTADIDSWRVSVFKNTSTGTGSISFAARKEFSTLLDPACVAIGDLDGNGKPDLAVATRNSAAVSILKNTTSPEAISFANPIGYETGNGPYGVSIADLNGDAMPDLISSNSEGTISVLVNRISLPIISSFSPAGGINGTLVTIKGFNFTGTTNVSFGGIPATSFTVLSDTSITAKVGTGSSGNVSVATTYGTGNLNGFTFFRPPVIDSFSPTTANYGTTVTIKGLHFTGTNSVLFGGLPASSFTIVSDSVITATVTTGLPGSVTIKNPAGTASLPGFVYTGPVVIGFTPTMGAPGTLVIIKGMNLTGTDSVKFGGIPADSFSVVSDTVIHAIVGGGATGNISVTTQDVTVFRPGFIYTGPLISSFAPIIGGNGTVVTIKGKGFTGSTAVSFGKTPSSSFVVVSDTIITAVVGTGSTGNITVTTPARAIMMAGFKYNATVPVITSFTPLSGPAGTTVTIKGINFSDTSAANIVYFGAVRARVISSSINQLSIIVPAGATYHPITITARNLTSYSQKAFVATFPGIDTITQNSFAVKKEYTTGAGPASVHLQDFDNDGKTDIVLANSTPGANSISVFKNNGTNGTISYDLKKDFTTGTSPKAIGIGDLDGDGKPDIVVSNSQSNTISLFRNTSTGTISFAAKVDYATGGTPNDVAIADFDGDGKPDIAVVNSSFNTVSILKNTSMGPGLISFAARTFYTTGSNPNAIALSDLDGDGLIDIAVANYASGTISILRNLSSAGIISFSFKKDFITGEQPRSVAIGDMDGDGKPDLSVANYNSAVSVSVLKNTCTPGTISFAIKKDFGMTSGTGSHSIAISDLNGDSKPDLAITNQIQNKLTLIRNTSTGGSISFDNGEDFLMKDDEPTSIAIGDMDGDNKPDLAVTNSASDSVSIFKNRSGDSTTTIRSFSPVTAAEGTTITIKGSSFTGATTVLFGNIPAASFAVISDTVITAVVGAGTSGNISIISPTGTGILAGFIYTGPAIDSFSPAIGGSGSVITIIGKNFTGATAVNFGGTNANSFIIVSDTLITAVVGNGASGPVNIITALGTTSEAGFTFTALPVILSFTPVSGPIGTVVTINGANFDNNAGNNLVYFGTAKAVIINGTVTQLTVIVPAGASYKPITVTSNGLITYSALPFNVTFVGGAVAFTSNSFATKTDYVTPDRPTSLSKSDLDGDGKQDIIFANSSVSTNTFSVLRNTSEQGLISFDTRIDFATGSFPWYFDVGDLDGDDKSDVAIITAPAVSIFRNTSSIGTISFATPVIFPTGSVPEHILLADIDGDGKVDIVQTNINDRTVSVFRNTSSKGNVSFTPRVNFATGDAPRRIALGDLNDDGKVDLVITNDWSYRISVFQNTSEPGKISFSHKSDYPTGVSPLNVSIGDLNADKKPELVVTNHSGGSVSIFRNIGINGNISFAPKIDITLSGVPDATALIIDDMNGDEKPDIVITRNSSKLMCVFKNTCIDNNISFAARVDYPTGLVAGNLSAIDLDKDGRSDLVVTNSANNSISVFRNTVAEAKIKPAGSNPVSGPVTNKITIDSSVQIVNGTPYVQRHYDIEPANNPSTATATITLYFTQQEFDNFNAHPGHGLNLPVYPTDSAGKANLRIYQYHGFSATGLPGSYSDTTVVINPADSSIVWNAAALCWEITFDVEGFSGFFVSSAGFAYMHVPSPSISAIGSTIFCHGDSVLLTSSGDFNNQWYMDNVLINGATSKTLMALTTGVYTATTRLKDVNSSPSAGIDIIAKPVPAKPVITSNGTDLLSSSLSGNQWYREGILINGANSPTYKPSNEVNYTVKVTENGCTSPESDNYHFLVTGVINIDNTHFIGLTPNPVVDHLSMSFKVPGSPRLNIQLIDQNGRVVRFYESILTGAQLNLSNLKAGVYIARMYSSTGNKTYTFKLVKL